MCAHMTGVGGGQKDREGLSFSILETDSLRLIILVVPVTSTRETPRVMIWAINEAAGGIAGPQMKLWWPSLSGTYPSGLSAKHEVT